MRENQIRKVAGRIATCMAVMAMTMMMTAHITADAATISYEQKGEGQTGVPMTAVYKGSRPGALIPSSIEFEGDTGHYVVYAYMEASEISAIDAVLNIVPESSFTMTKDGAWDTLTATVSQDRTSFGKSELEAGIDSTLNMNGTEVAVKQSAGNGTIIVEGMTIGTWRGNLIFHITAEDIQTDPEPSPEPSPEPTPVVTGRYICECGWYVDVYDYDGKTAENKLYEHLDETGHDRWHDIDL